MTVTTDPLSAAWTSDDDEYRATVTATTHRNAEGEQGWRWDLYWTGGHAWGATNDLIWAPDDDEAIDVLATLAHFLGVWDDALAWEERYKGLRSDNGDLFGRGCIEFRPAIEEFSMWAFEHTNPDEI